MSKRSCDKLSILPLSALVKQNTEASYKFHSGGEMYRIRIGYGKFVTAYRNGRRIAAPTVSTALQISV